MVQVVPSDFSCIMEGSGTIRPAVQRAVALFNLHYEGEWHYKAGSIEGSGTFQPAL